MAMATAFRTMYITALATVVPTAHPQRINQALMLCCSSIMTAKRMACDGTCSGVCAKCLCCHHYCKVARQVALELVFRGTGIPSVESQSTKSGRRGPRLSSSPRLGSGLLWTALVTGSGEQMSQKRHTWQQLVLQVA
jgi:hypothetical protein